MCKHCYKKNQYRIAVATTVATLLCVYLFLPVSAGSRKSFQISFLEARFNRYMSDGVAIPLSKMIGTAEIIVWGEVTVVKESSVVLHIIKCAQGSRKENEIEILKVIPDKFASVQPAPYQKGQQFILFLTQPDDLKMKSTWKVMGVGGEGQMPVENGFVYFQGNNIHDLKFEEYTVQGTKLYIQRFEFKPFFNAIEGYTTCFKWSRNNADNKAWKPKKICSDVQVAAYSNNGFMQKYLSGQTDLMMSGK